MTMTDRKPSLGTQRTGFRMLLLMLTSVPAAPAAYAQAEDPSLGTVVVRALGEEGPVAGAQVSAGRTGALTNERGEATLRLPAGERTLRVSKIGLAPVTVRTVVRPSQEATLEVHLEVHAEELEGIVVSSTRTGQRIEDEPTRVEVLAREEVEEKMLMTPGDIAMMLNETSGLRVQSTSPSLGGASVRIQGLRGRYTQLLADGLPLYGGQSGALGLLQIPPMDLGQVEVIKGGASALYGSSALGGVVNLISRRPQDERELLLNQTTRGGTDGVLWLSRELNHRWGYTLLGSVHHQSQADVDDDGWADLPGYRRAVVRPRLFWNDGAGRSVFLTAGATVEDRAGGTRSHEALPSGTPFPEELETRRLDIGLVGRVLLPGDRLLSARASAMGQRHRHLFGEARERDVHATGFGEVTLSGTDADHTWVLGAALQQEHYEARDVDGFDYAHTTPALFVQDDYHPAEWLALSASGRVDFHSEYGTFFNPRLSLLLRPGAGWTTRASVGTGTFAPTPFTEETEAVGLGRLAPLGDLEAERAQSASLDVGRSVGDFELNGTLFASRVQDALLVRVAEDGALVLFNADEPTRTWGTELLARWHREPFHLTATHTYLRSTEVDPQGHVARREVPMTPRHAVGAVGMWEAEGRGRVGLEVYYTGRQALADNPYRATSPPYLILGLLAERRVGPARLFLNAENLLDVRQTRHDPVLLPARSPEGRWTTDLWAPLEGRVLNAGVRYAF
jgi:iron complex outermembrane receptor protein